MKFNQVTGGIISHIVGRLILRAFFALFGTICFIVAIAYLTLAGSVTLEVRYGALHAQLAIAAIYATVTLITFTVLLATRAKTISPPPLSKRGTQIAMLVEAIARGYALAHKRERAH